MPLNVDRVAALAALMLLAACGYGGHVYTGGDVGIGAQAVSGPGASYAPPGGAPALQDGPVDDGSGVPRATSGQGDATYDQVGYAAPMAGTSGLGMASSVLSVGTYVEVTALDSGHTVLLQVTSNAGIGSGTLIALSPAAISALQLTGANAAVRVRQVNPSAQDQAAVQRGIAPTRLDSPPPLLAGLRHMLPAAGGSAPPPPVRAGGGVSAGVKAPPPAVRGTIYIQVAALSNAARAKDLAGQLGGSVVPGGGLYRVQIGPYATRADAERKRADVAAHGFPDARVFEKR